MRNGVPHMKTSLCANVQLNRSNFDFNLKSSLTPFFHRALQLEFMGILLDSSTMEARLPDDKLTRLRSLVSSWQAKTCCHLQDLQWLIGSLHFACKVVVPGRPFLRRMIALTCRARQKSRPAFRDK